MRKNKLRIVEAAQYISPKIYSPFLTDDDERVISGTFLRLAQLCHTLPSVETADKCLLLLTTCRNEWYTLNAMYAEGLKWCKEGITFTGYGDVLDDFRGAITGVDDFNKALRNASRKLETTAEYLYEFNLKYDLYYNKFGEIYKILNDFCETIEDPISRAEFKKFIVDKGSGPSGGDLLEPPTETKYDIYLERLLSWVAHVRPLTSLTRTFLSETFGIGKGHGVLCKEYLERVKEAALIYRSYGFRCPEAPDESIFSVSMEDDQKDRLEKFLNFCDESLKVSKKFLKEMLPATNREDSRFMLFKPGEEENVKIQGRNFRIHTDAFVLITDMRNSTGARYLTPDLKAGVANIIDKLKDEQLAKSQTTYDDCRVVACKNIDALIDTVARLWKGLEPHISETGFSGLRIGATCGDMLMEIKGDWEDIRKNAAPSDSSHNTIARAARLMGLDKTRWESSQQGRRVLEGLGDWGTDNSILFMDTAIYGRMPENIQRQCREIGSIDLRGAGPKVCWAISINQLVQLNANLA